MGRPGLGQRPRSGRRGRLPLISMPPFTTLVAVSFVAVPRGRGTSASGASTSRQPPAPNAKPQTPNPKLQTPNQAVGTRFLKGSDASTEDVATILRGLGVLAKFRMFETCSDVGLDAPARLALMRHTDSQQPAAEADFKLGLSRVELVALVGGKAVRSLEATFRHFGGDAYRSAARPALFFSSFLPSEPFRQFQLPSTACRVPLLNDQRFSCNL